MHIHGFGGVDVMDNNIEGTLHTMSEGLLSTGVTSFLPTTLTSSYEQLLAVTENIGARYQEASGAKIRGIYFEGLLANDFNWISLPPRGERTVEAKTRYNGKAVPAIVSVRENGDVFLRFPEKERAVTKGQAVVLYDGELVLGGGTIVEGYKKL